MAHTLAPETVIPIEASLLVLATLLASCRLVPRFLQRHYPTLSDCFLVASILDAFALFITDVMTYSWGGMSGGSVKTSEPSTTRAISLKKVQFAGNYFYDTGIYLPKLAILALYFRLFPPTMPWLRKALYIVSFFTASAMTATCFLDTFWCGRHVSINWSLDDDACSTFSSKMVFRVDWGMNVVTDLLVCILPFPLLHQLQLNRRQIWGLIVTFSLGAITIIVSVIRFATIEVIKAWTNVFVLSMAEIAVAIMVVSLPSMRAYVRRGGIFSKRKYGDSSSNHQHHTANTRSDHLELSSNSKTKHRAGDFQDEEDSGSEVELNMVNRKDVIYETRRISVQFSTVDETSAKLLDVQPSDLRPERAVPADCNTTDPQFQILRLSRNKLRSAVPPYASMALSTSKPIKALPVSREDSTFADFQRSGVETFGNIRILWRIFAASDSTPENHPSYTPLCLRRTLVYKFFPPFKPLDSSCTLSPKVLTPDKMAYFIDGNDVMISEWILLALAYIFVAARIYTRLFRLRQKLDWSDYLLIASALDALALIICDTLTYQMGVLDEYETSVKLSKISFASNYFYDFGMGFPKLSMLAFYWAYFNLSAHPGMRKMLYGMTGFVVACYLAILFDDTFFCGSDVSVQWSQEDGACSVFYAPEPFILNFTLNLACYLVVYSIPAILLAKGILAGSKGVTLTFALGALTIISGIVRFVCLKVGTGQENLVYPLSMVEMALSIIVVSLPGLKPLLSGSRSSSSASTIEESHYTEQTKSSMT
ncbi:hypothetical protein OPT61_g1556 [Boeremia exigua]|uniref:Uncharacterized protein n=1 Tax=Boeremia exigua TaxID=749465 RepID=A0ACC2IPZ9_9PLEO|nr:hypothetical protein OPT61_g1556 [Boeremia exigua]